MRFLPRLGLRAQIVLSLSLVFALSSWLVGFATVQLTRRSAEFQIEREERMMARALAPLIHGDFQDDALQRICGDLRRTAKLIAMRVQHNDGRVFRCGDAPARPAARMALSDGARLYVWFAAELVRPSAPFTHLLLFYMALTGLAVLLLSYVALTHLIVRPLEQLTHSAARLSTGSEHVFVKVRGSAEVARLAQSFNEMATMLRAERARLVERLAQLERTTHQLESKEQQLIHGEKLASIGRLAAGVAHEIGNPLAAILGFVELLREGGLSENESQEFLTRIHRETERINRIIRDLLDFARRDVDDRAPQQTADLREVISDAVNLVRPQKESKDIVIGVVVDPSTRRVVGPQHRLTQVVLNLLLNAVDALEGKGKIEISVAPSRDDKSVVLLVQDDGPGIAPAMLGRLFDPFTTTKPAGKGTGLGLAVSHAIIDGLLGSIEAGNRPEGGARFEVRLRQAPPPAAAASV